MNESNKGFDVKFNLGFVVRVTPNSLQKIEDFIKKLDDVTIVFSKISGNKLFIKEEK